MGVLTNGAASQQQMKATNLNLLFNLINRHEPVSRVRLSQVTNLSPTTVSSLVEELITAGLVCETGRDNSGGVGRRAIHLQVNPTGGYVASVDMQEKGLSAGLFNLKSEQIAGRFVALDSFESIGEAIVSAIREMQSEIGLPAERLAGVCLSAPGLIDIDSKRVLASTVIQIDPENTFYDRVSQAFSGTPVILGNESSFCAYAEKDAVGGPGAQNMLLIDINTGVGAGILIDGGIFTGSMGIAGEIGHISIDCNGPKCKCGSRGCLEVMASIPALMQRAMFTVMSRRESILCRLCGNDPAKLTYEMVCEAFAAQDGMAVEVVSETARCLAFGINNTINLLNPQAIVLAGKIRQLGDPFLALLKEQLAGIAFAINSNRLELCFSSVGENSALAGGASYLLCNAFSNGSLLSWLK